MRKVLSFYMLIAFMAVACSNDKDDVVSTLNSPRDVAAERVTSKSVKVSWTDTNEEESGYAVYYSHANDVSFKLIEKLPANTTEYVISDLLEEGNNYYLGVSAFNNAEESRIISTIYKMEVLADMPVPKLSELKSEGNCLTAQYTLNNVSGLTNVEYGLCWSADVTPTIDSEKIIGPAVASDGKVFQVIPNVVLKPGTEYKVRAYVKSVAGTYYSAEKVASIENDADAITLDWKKLSIADLPSEIEVYETTSTLNGDPFHAWYAIADVSGNVEFRVQVPQSFATVDDQAKAHNGNCYVLVNAGYFTASNNTGVSVINSVASGNINAVRGSLKTQDDEYNELYNITRGIFGVDSEGKPDVKWVGSDAKSTKFYYDCPMPVVKGENKYKEPSAKYPVNEVKWAPKYAHSAGPVLLKNGVIPFDFKNTASGADFYLSNYEIIPYDIYGTGVTPDRTAVGYREDGKVIIFICDGRISQSGGATLVELAQVLKGLGCVGAVNFDGGGSTGMVVCGTHLNDMSSGNRAVASTLGFFKK